MERRAFGSALIACVFVGSLTSACVESGLRGPTLSGSDPLEIHAEDSGMPLSVALAEGSVVRGENVFEVRFSEPAAELTGVSAVMPGHGHDTGSPTIERSDGAYRVSGLLLFMPGRWEVTLEFELAGTLDHAVFNVDVP